jgi:hypothetical protein
MSPPRGFNGFDVHVREVRRFYGECVLCAYKSVLTPSREKGAALLRAHLQSEGHKREREKAYAEG